MGSSRFDVVVVGGGPAGSVAALVLARAGVRVAMIDKAAFPRDKACGDIVGPRGLQILTELGLPRPTGRDVGEIAVVGPTGRMVQLPCGEGLTYPGHGTAVTRTVFDSFLHDAAVDCGCRCFPWTCRGAPRGARANRRIPVEHRPRSARRLRDRSGWRHEPGGSGCADGRYEEGAVGVRRPDVRRRSRRRPGHRVLGAGALGSLSGLRVGVSGARRNSERRIGSWDRGGSTTRSESPAGAPEFPGTRPKDRTPDRRREDGRLEAPGRLAQDGCRRDDSGAGSGAPCRRCRRSRQPPAGRGDRPGHGQRSCRGGSIAGRARACRGALPGRTGSGPSAVPPDHRSRAGVAGRPAPRHCSPVPGAHDCWPERRHRRRMVGVLERTARRRTPQSTPVRRGGDDPSRPAHDGALVDRPMVQCRRSMETVLRPLGQAEPIGPAGVGRRRTRRPQPHWSEVSRCQTGAEHRFSGGRLGVAPAEPRFRARRPAERRRRNLRRRAATHSGGDPRCPRMGTHQMGAIQKRTAVPIARGNPRRGRSSPRASQRIAGMTHTR